MPPRLDETDVYNTVSVSLDDYLFLPVDNALSFIYTAVDSEGNTIDMTATAMKLDFLNFEYVEGYFGERIFDIQGDIIEVGLFDKWISGGLEFEDPKVSVRVENSFGFPVKTEFQKLQFKTINGTIYDIESGLIEEGVAFDYPGLDEVGEVKKRGFTFNKTNSIILNKESYFRIDVSVDLSLNGIVNELVISDTLDFDLNEVEDVNSAEFKFVVRNDFPSTVNVQAVILNAQNNPIDVIFEGDGIILDAAMLGADGRTVNGETTIEYVNLPKDRINTIKEGKRIVLVASIDSKNVSDDYLWFYSDYEIDFKLGAILNLEN